MIRIIVTTDPNKRNENNQGSPLSQYISTFIISSFSYINPNRLIRITIQEISIESSTIPLKITQPYQKTKFLKRIITEIIKGINTPDIPIKDIPTSETFEMSQSILGSGNNASSFTSPPHAAATSI